MTDCSAGTGTSALQRSVYDIIGSGRTFRRSRCRRCGSMNAAGYSRMCQSWTRSTTSNPLHHERERSCAVVRSVGGNRFFRLTASA